MQFAHVCTQPLDLYIGNFDGCNKCNLPKNCNRLHVFHESQPGDCNIIKTGCITTSQNEFDHFLGYKEHDLLYPEQIDLITKLATADNPLFIHCAAGLGRSPTIAVLALTIRGLPPWNAMSIVAEAMWKQYAIPHCPSYNCKVLNQVFEIYNKLNHE